MTVVRNGRAPALPALRDRKLSAIADRLALVTAEVASGARRRLDAEQQRKLAASVVWMYHCANTRADRALFDDKRERVLMARLKENGNDVGELLYASDGAIRDDYFAGKKDGRPKLSVDMVFRDRSRIEELARSMKGYRDDEPHPKLAEYAAALGMETEVAGAAR